MEITRKDSFQWEYTLVSNERVLEAFEQQENIGTRNEIIIQNIEASFRENEELWRELANY